MTLTDNRYFKSFIEQGAKMPIDLAQRASYPTASYHSSSIRFVPDDFLFPSVGKLGLDSLVR